MSTNQHSTHPRQQEISSTLLESTTSQPSLALVQFSGETRHFRPNQVPLIEFRCEDSSTSQRSLLLHQQTSFFSSRTMITRRSFVNQIDPVLRDVQNRRGLENYRIVCDESNNPGSVVDRGEFVCDIFLQPTKSVQFVKLNFVANNSGSFFTEA